MENKTINYIFNDILGKILELSENPREFSDYLSQQIRELVGVRIVVITVTNEFNETQLLSVFPPKRKIWAKQSAIYQLAEYAFSAQEIQYINSEITDETISSILKNTEVENAITIPLNAGQRKVGSILLLDLMDSHGIESVLHLLEKLSGVFALIIRNSMLYQNMESLVEIKTRELQIRNEQLEERKQQLLQINQEFEVLNEELSENLTRTDHLNEELFKQKEKAEESEKSIHNLLNNLQAGVVVHSADTSIIKTNPRACELLGLSEDQLKGKKAIDPAWKFVRNDLSIMPLDEFPVQIVLNTKKLLINHVVGVIRPSCNDLVWLLVNGTPIFNDAKVITEVIINFVDFTERRKAEEDLLENTIFLDKIIESSAVSTWISNKEGTAIRVNQACLDFFGATKNEVLGKYNIFKDVVIQEKGFMPEIHKVFNEGKIANIILDYDFGDVEHVTVENATHKIVNSIFTPVINSENEITNVIVQSIDLTEIKKVEEKTKAERNKAQQYLDIAGVMLLSLNNEGIIQLINPKGCDILGYTKEEILGENWYNKFLPTREIPKVKKIKGRALLGYIDEMRYFENFIKTKSGEERLIAWKNSLMRNEEGNIIGTLSSGEDITERRKTELDLKKAKMQAEESEKQLKMISNNLVNGMIYQVATLDENTRKFNYVSDTVKTLYGCTADEAMKDPNLIYGKIYKDDIDDLILKEKEALKKMSVFKVEARVVNPDGSLRWSYYLSQPRLLNGYICWDGIEVDITERKKIEEELIIAKKKAEETDHLKTAFLQNMSHEIRTPMNSIMGFASLLPDEEDKNLIDSYSQIIVKNSEQLVHIIDDIVIYSRLQNKQMPISNRKFDLEKILLEIKNSFNIPEYNNGVNLLIDNCCKSTKTINSDYEKVWQIFTNLISNAFKYTPTGIIKFGIKTKENQWLCFVSDTGIGIPKNEINIIFDRFYRASNVNKNSINGTGLGLSIVKELVQLIGGNIWVESEEGKGSTFFFTIPIS